MALTDQERGRLEDMYFGYVKLSKEWSYPETDRRRIVEEARVLIQKLTDQPIDPE